MSRPMIQCPACHRELYNLQRPQCLWCGERLSTEQFEQVALPAQSYSSSVPQPMPPGYGPSGYGASWNGPGLFWRRLIPWGSISGSISPWERKLRIAGVALAACLLLGKLAEFLWMLWHMHQTMLPPH